MDVTENDLKEQVMIDVADDGTVRLSISKIWNKYSGYTLWSRYLAARIDAVDLLIAKNRNAVRVSGDGRTMDLQQIISNLLTLRKLFVEAFQADAASVGFDTEVSYMTTVASIEAAPGYVDPNDVGYFGVPFPRKGPVP